MLNLSALISATIVFITALIFTFSCITQVISKIIYPTKYNYNEYGHLTPCFLWGAFYLIIHYI